MTRKGEILILASWFNPETTIGSFFIEQAELLYSSGLDVCMAYPSLSGHQVIRRRIGNIETFSFPQFDLKIGSSKLLGIFQALINRRLFLKFYEGYIQSRKIEKVIAFNIQSAGFCAFWLYKKFKIPYILVQHNPFIPNDKSYFNNNWRIGQVLKKSKFSFAVSNDLIRRFRLFGRYEQMSVLHNPFCKQMGMNARGCFELNRVNSLEGKIIIGISGQFCDIKNQFLLFRSFKYLELSESLNLKVVWMGYDSWNRGVDKVDLLNRLESIGFSNSIELELYANLSRIDMMSKMSECHVFVSTSYNETFGLSCLEALSLGIPVCTTQTGGCNEYMTNFTGVIVNSFDEREFAIGLSSLINNLSEFDADYIREFVFKHFSSERYIEKVKTALA